MASGKLITFRASEEQKKAIEEKATSYGFDSVSAYIKFVCMNAELVATVVIPEPTSSTSKETT